MSKFQAILTDYVEPRMQYSELSSYPKSDSLLTFWSAPAELSNRLFPFRGSVFRKEFSDSVYFRENKLSGKLWREKNFFRRREKGTHNFILRFAHDNKRTLIKKKKSEK